MIKDQLMNNEGQKIISPYCPICKIRGHDFMTCNKMHYVPDKDFGFDSYYYSNSNLELFLKKAIGFIGNILKMNFIEFNNLFK